MGGGGVSTNTSYQRAADPSVYQPVAPTRTVAQDPGTLDKALFTEGAKLSDKELEKKTAATSRLVIPLDTSNSSITGGTTPPPTPTRIV